MTEIDVSAGADGARAFGATAVVDAVEDVHPGLLAVRRQQIELLPLGQDLAWLEEVAGGIVVGGSYLFYGCPGGGKSRIATKIALALGKVGIPTLHILTEQSDDELLQRSLQLTSNWQRHDIERSLRMMKATNAVERVEDLPFVLNMGDFRRGGIYEGVRLIILDSVHGDGIAAGNHRAYQRFYSFSRDLKENGVTLITVAHETKSGRIAGPRGLEHHADVVWRIEKAGTNRLLAVTKNRFGIEDLRGITLLTDPLTGDLHPAPEREPVTGVARTFVGSAIGSTELQAQISLPLPGQKPRITAPGLPHRRIEQLVRGMASIRSLDFENVDLDVSALLPRDLGYRSYFGLPLAISLVAALTRREVPTENIYLGEVDLKRSVLPLPNEKSEFSELAELGLVPRTTGILTALRQALEAGEIPQSAKLFVAPATAKQLEGIDVEIVRCSTLDQAILATWPDLH